MARRNISYRVTSKKEREDSMAEGGSWVPLFCLAVMDVLIVGEGPVFMLIGTIYRGQASVSVEWSLRGYCKVVT